MTRNNIVSVHTYMGIGHNRYGGFEVQPYIMVKLYVQNRYDGFLQLQPMTVKRICITLNGLLIHVYPNT